MTPTIDLTDEQLIERLKEAANEFSNLLTVAAKRSISVEVVSRETMTTPGMKSWEYRVTGAWKQLIPPSIFLPQ